MYGILDRFEGDEAVILIEEIEMELIVNKSELPNGSQINTVFNLEKQDESYKIKSIDTTYTKAAAQKSSNLMAKLRAKSSGSKFKK